MLPSPQFSGQPVSVQAEQCLNVRHKDAGCQRCVDACPTQAITLQNHDNRSPLRPQLNAEQCIRCGLCLHHCPTDVFSQLDPLEAKLGQTLANLPGIPLNLVCPQHPNPATTPAPVGTVVRHQRCLVSLSLSQLIDLSHNGQRDLWLDDTPCVKCPLGQVQPLITQIAETTNRLLQAFGKTPAIHTHLSQQETLNIEPKQVALIEGDQPKLSRRGLFGALGQLTRQAVDKAAATSLPTPAVSGPVPVSQRLPYHLPESRKHLIQQLTRLGEPIEESVGTAGLPFADVKIDANACSACRLCARFCPTEALHFVADSERFGISFRPTMCVACGICAVACPENAVSFDAHLAPADLVADKARWLVVGQLTACASCSESTAIRSNESGSQSRCFVCRQSDGPPTSLKDTAGLMADLLNGDLAQTAAA